MEVKNIKCRDRIQRHKTALLNDDNSINKENDIYWCAYYHLNKLIKLLIIFHRINYLV